MRKIMFSVMMLVAMASVASAKEGFYIGGQIPYNMVKGDFDDTTAPKLKSGAGFGLIAGYTFPINLAVEVDFSRSSHQADSPSFTGSVALAEISLNGKYSFMTTDLQPYILAGVGSFAMGSFETSAGSSFIISGTGYNLGVGADYYVSPNVSVGAGIIQKFITFTKTDNSNVTIKDTKGDTTSVRFDVAYHF